MSKYTPGPWSVGVPGPNGCPTIGTNYGLMTAMIAHSRNEPDQVEECNANANLIAAAPDLLEACEEFRNVLRSKIRDGKYREEYAEAFYQAERKMERAIARAKGESQ